MINRIPQIKKNKFHNPIDQFLAQKKETPISNSGKITSTTPSDNFYYFSKIHSTNSPKKRIDYAPSKSLFATYFLIIDYFQSDPSKRKGLSKTIAKNIKSTNIVLKILEWGTSRKIPEAFDATVMLLAECGNIIISTLESMPKINNDIKDIFLLEERWEILIKSIACATHIPIHQRFDAMIKLIPDSNRRLIKTAIIDALLIMEDEIDSELIKSQLQHFLSDDEHDNYVKEYAKEAWEDI